MDSEPRESHQAPKLKVEVVDAAYKVGTNTEVETAKAYRLTHENQVTRRSLIERPRAAPILHCRAQSSGIIVMKPAKCQPMSVTKADEN